MFDRVVFAGGGHRCWWQAGWWETVAPAIALKPSRIAGVSAGAATACLLYANDVDTALKYYHSALADNARNFYAGRWRGGRGAMFPHERIYRDALSQLVGGMHFERLQRNAPEIRIAFARPPQRVPTLLAVGAGLIAYQMEKHWRKPLHPRMGRRIGFTAEYETVQSCASEQQLVDLIIASSCTPPFTAMQQVAGQVSLDGGLVDNVPIDALDGAGASSANGQRPDTLVLLTRRYPGYPTVFVINRLVYVQPSRKVAASSWDYTAPTHYDATAAQGREDAALFLQWLESPAGSVLTAS